MLERAFADGERSPRRTARNLIDMGMNLSKGRNVLFTFGMNLGYNGCTKGAKQIRSIEKETGNCVPCTATVVLQKEKLDKQTDIYQGMIEFGKKQGRYIYVLKLEEGNLMKLAEILKKNAECAFCVLLGHTEISDLFLETVRKIGNALISVRENKEAGRIGECHWTRMGKWGNFGQFCKIVYQ